MSKRGAKFGAVSVRERRAAELFFADLTGTRSAVRPPRRASLRAEVAPPVSHVGSIYEGDEGFDYDGGHGYGETVVYDEGYGYAEDGYGHDEDGYGYAEDGSPDGVFGCDGGTTEDEDDEDDEDHEDFAGEAMVGQVNLGVRQRTVDASAAAIRSGVTLHDGILHALAQRMNHTLVTGSPLNTASTANVHTWGPPMSLVANLAISFDATNVAALMVNGGQRAYFQANPLATAPADRLPWVHVPGLHEFLSMPAAQQTSQRNEWAAKVQRARLTNPATSAQFTRTELRALPTPALRLLLAHNATRTIPVTSITRRGVDRGGVAHGVTLPRPVYPVVEPRVYLRVISMREGKMESINAWDLEAGISPGPIQINVTRGTLFKFLWEVWEGDRALFQRHFGAPLNWEMRKTGNVPELRVTVGGAQQWLRGVGTSPDKERNYGYFQSGDPTRQASNQLDPAFRRDVAQRLRNVIVWPHVQEMLERISGEWLQPGLDRIHRAGIPALDRNNPDRDTFILKAMLLSTYVRFSGCLQPLLDAMAGWRTVADKLANWRTAVSTMTGPCNASGTQTQRDRNALIVTRLGHQQTDATTVFADLTALRTAAGARP